VHVDDVGVGAGDVDHQVVPSAWFIFVVLDPAGKRGDERRAAGGADVCSLVAAAAAKALQ